MAAFEHKLRVRFQHTDPAGIVFFANILVYRHEAYEEFLRHGGGPPGAVPSERGRGRARGRAGGPAEGPPPAPRTGRGTLSVALGSRRRARRPGSAAVVLTGAPPPWPHRSAGAGRPAPSRTGGGAGSAASAAAG